MKILIATIGLAIGLVLGGLVGLFIVERYITQDSLKTQPQVLRECPRHLQDIPQKGCPKVTDNYGETFNPQKAGENR